MRSVLRATGLASLVLAFLASTSGLCLCCPVQCAEPEGHACCTPGGAALRGAVGPCAAMTEPPVAAAFDHETGAPIFAASATPPAPLGQPALPWKLAGGLDPEAGSAHRPPPSILRN